MESVSWMEWIAWGSKEVFVFELVGQDWEWWLDYKGGVFRIVAGAGSFLILWEMCFQGVCFWVNQVESA